MESVRLFFDPVGSSKTICNVTRIGIHETMQKGIVNRPLGTGDWMFVYFHDSVFIKTHLGITQYPPGSFIIWTNTDGHYYGNPNNKWMHSWVHFQGNSILPIISSSGIKTDNIFKLSSSTIFVKSLKDIYLELIEPIDPDLVILQNLFQNMLLRLVRQIGIDEKIQIIPQRIIKIKSIIEFNPSKQYTISSLAKEASMSPPNFCAEFKKYVGIPPIKYLIKVRLQNARFLLYEHNMSITKIAESVGYNDIFHFSKQFKKHFGVSPSYFQQKNNPVKTQYSMM